jgi:hypothetical protein
MEATASGPVERLWKAAECLPESVRLLGTRYRALFLAYAPLYRPHGKASPVADAMAFVDFMFRQERVGLLDNEREALRGDQRALRRRFRLRSKGSEIEAVEKWRIAQWLGL